METTIFPETSIVRLTFSVIKRSITIYLIIDPLSIIVYTI